MNIFLKIFLTALVTTLAIIILYNLIYLCTCNKTYKDTYTENYDNMTTYISLTSTPERITTDFFYSILKNLLSFCNKDIKIILNIPYIFRKTGEQYRITSELEKIINKANKKIILNRCEDHGPITKIIPTLNLTHISSKDIIIVCDDDIFYRKKFPKYLINAVIKDPESVHSYCTNEIEGFAGYAATKQILSNILNYNMPDSCKKLDDNYIEACIKASDIKIKAVEFPNSTNKIKHFCSIDQKKTDEHPSWDELGSDRPQEHINRCVDDFKTLNK